MAKRSPTTKDIALLWQLFKSNQLELAPEFQRNAVWPRPAKVYLIDTIVNDKPIPILFLARGRSAQTGQTVYSVVDGQQRLRAIFEYLDNRFKLTQSTDSAFRGKNFGKLSPAAQDRILNYDLNIEELTGYTDSDIRDIFARINKYVVKLSPQELRNAKSAGAFHGFADEIGKWSYWRENRILSKKQIARMRGAEFAAELAILLIEGPQDKKTSVDLYYGQFKKQFSYAAKTKSLLSIYLKWIKTALPDISHMRFRKPVDLYSLIGALDELSNGGRRLKRINVERAAAALQSFEKDLGSKSRSKLAERYAAAASRQTDNIAPRTTRIDVIKSVLESAR